MYTSSGQTWVFQNAKKEKKTENPTFKNSAILSYLKKKILSIFWIQVSLAEPVTLVLQGLIPMGPQIWEAQVSCTWCNISVYNLSPSWCAL